MQSSAPTTEPCETRLGEFAIAGVLGRGGSGIVYAAVDGDGREVALKVMHETLSLSPDERRRFFEEAQRMRRVDHEGLVALLGSGELPDGRPYICMPRLRGETLHARLRRGALPVDEALALFEGMAGALSALHAAGLLHRDIKPSNVFLVANESGARPVLLDFGIARDVADPSGTTTAAGRVRGTPAYMAPERLFGTGATVRSDVYELAVTLYSMLVGRRPWDRDEDPESRLNPMRPEDVGVRLPGALSTCLLRALSTRPELRPGSAGEFAELVRSAKAATEPSSRETVTLDALPVPPAVAMALPEATTEQMTPGRRSRAGVVAVVAAVTGIAVVGFAAMRAPRTDAATASVAATPTPSPTPSPSATPSATPTPTPTSTPTSTPTPTPTASPAAAARPSPRAPSHRAPASLDHYYNYRK